MLKRLAALSTVAALATPLIAVSATVAPASAATKNAMTVTARDFAYVIDGKLRPGQASVTLTNKGKEPHVMAIIKTKPGVTIKQIKKALNSRSDAAFGKIAAGNPDASYGTPDFLTPGGTSTTITDLFTPGSYAMICFLADAKGKPHFAHGMIQLFKVAGKPVKPTPVQSDGTVVLTDDSITTPPSPAPTSVTVEIDNQGTAPHSFAVVKLNGTATMQDVDAFFDSYQGGPLPADAPGAVVSGVGDIPPGKHVYLSWKNLEPGRYGYASASGGDENGQNDDISKGLIGEFTVE